MCASAVFTTMRCFQDETDASPGIVSSQIKAKLGRKAYSAVRRRILEHMEVFVENIYDLHRLARRQHHLEGICEDKETYAAELARLVAPASANPPSAEPEPAAAVAAAGAAPSLEKPEQEVITCLLQAPVCAETHLCRQPCPRQLQINLPPWAGIRRLVPAISRSHINAPAVHCAGCKGGEGG